MDESNQSSLPELLGTLCIGNEERGCVKPVRLSVPQNVRRGYYLAPFRL